MESNTLLLQHINTDHHLPNLFIKSLINISTLKYVISYEQDTGAARDCKA